MAVTYGAGALNVVNAVASAYAECSPLVILAGCPGEVEAHSGLVLHHQVRSIDSQLRIFSEITCDQVRLSNADTAPEDIARVLRNCREYSQPVLIEIPRDMTLQPMREVPCCRRAASTRGRGRGRRRMARAHPRRQNPVMVVDVEVRRFGVEGAWSSWRAACSCPCSPPSWAGACWPKTGWICTAPTWRGGRPETTRAAR